MIKGMEPKEGDTIAVWFSCGAASAVAAKITLQKYDNLCNVRIVNNPVLEEHPDNLRFLKDCEGWLGKPIEFATNKNFPNASADEVWRKVRYMAGHKGAPCTVKLKKEARQQWETENHIDWHVMGFTIDERNRYDRFIQTERDNVLPILIEANINKARCFEILAAAGIKRPAIYDLGYPNANCIGCVKGQYGKYWNLVRKTYPETFKARCELSRELNVRLWKVSDDDRRFLDELPEDYDDGQMVIDFECGIFCEEKPTTQTTQEERG